MEICKNGEKYKNILMFIYQQAWMLKNGNNINGLEFQTQGENNNMDLSKNWLQYSVLYVILANHMNSFCTLI